MCVRCGGSQCPVFNMKKRKKSASEPKRVTSKSAFLKAVRKAQQRATEAKRTARVAKLQWKAAKTAYKEARDAAHAAKKAVRAAQKALPGALRESRKAADKAARRK
jgi:hypothetical protein